MTTATTTIIDLQKFCATDYQRPHIRKPTRCAEGIVATNGEILLCVPYDGRECDSTMDTIAAQVAKFHHGLMGEDDERRWVDVTAIALPPKVGTGEDFQAVFVGGTHFQRRYLAMLADLPGCRIGLSVEELGMAVYRFDGGWGALAPCRGAAGANTKLWTTPSWRASKTMKTLSKHHIEAIEKAKTEQQGVRRDGMCRRHPCAEGEDMTKEQALEILKLLSALESWSFSTKHDLPDYLHESLCSIIDQLTVEVLK